jgi:hypothetical protein
MPRAPHSYIRIIVALYMWFCDHLEWLGGWVVGRLPLFFGVWFGFVGVRFLFTYVCIFFCHRKEKNVCCSPHGSPFVEQVAVASLF